MKSFQEPVNERRVRRMKSRIGIGLLLVAGLLAAPTAMLTHHSNADVDKDKLVTATGTVTKFAFTNPHVAVYWEGQDGKGSTVEWYAAGAGPKALAEVGWNNKTIKFGEKIL